MDERKFHRHSIRLKGYDYTRPGAYFVTLVIEGRNCFFGEVEAGQMQPNSCGCLVENEWRRLEVRFKKVLLDEWTVMPNHLHGILVMVEEKINDNEDTWHPGARQEGWTDVGARQGSSRKMEESSFASPLLQRHISGAVPGSLGAIVGSFKSTTTRLVNGLRHSPGTRLWQRNYYEHILRNEEEWEAIRAYIHENPSRWKMDLENLNRA
jgi:REP element-mobilizing transposase RayT